MRLIQISRIYTEENVPWENASPSNRIGNLTSHDPTMFCILKSVNLALNPNFCIMRAYFREANLLSSSDLAPVTTILPDAKISAVVFGSRILMMTAAKRYISPLAHLTLACHRYLWIIFCISGMQCNCLEIQSTIQIHCCHNIPFLCYFMVIVTNKHTVEQVLYQTHWK